ncbi:hypothetical protein [Brevibacterium senegalense]|uniref:hypothetical protein n=1 Tax=Brevibacterium senegalense TaxID=1033736 RepID=UPI0011C728AB|nr:hypothetical protein [Brevibacterium senegalense]
MQSLIVLDVRRVQDLHKIIDTESSLVSACFVVRYPPVIPREMRIQLLEFPEIIKHRVFQKSPLHGVVGAVEKSHRSPILGDARNELRLFEVAVADKPVVR